ncbi:LPS export ABC transporter permease LptF [Thiorhodococcus mannitoliphagus]|uniref:Lipopolysaccharide export system permease protein LptF n=1 Tax=Thiorhodococcus mannitoliphagus TaxID=329406 RepID=A0A6P1DXW3_9GAMM|nr:LPS export ABC transporter permease LptF [Thiorhodococcus mannitoliphagus]NEX20554.1 LPS export ABC transporter permease LptF [Thiorhodococcus mannitoliphagus]
MPGIVDRYILLEVLKVFLAIVVVLMLIVVSLMFLRTLEEVNVGGLGVDIVFHFMRLQLMRDTSSLLPPAFFLAVLVALSRFSRDSELIAMNACGIGPPRIYRNLFLLAIPVAVLTAWLALVLQPKAAAGIQEIRLQQKEQAAQVAGLQAGRFYVEEQGDVVVYIGEIDRRKSLGDVFILDRRGGKSRLVVSEGGQHRIEEATGDHLVTLSSGHRFDGTPGSGAYLIGDFKDYEIRIPGGGPTKPSFTKRSTIPTRELLQSSELEDRVELEHRVAAPLAIFTLAVMAIPLVDISPRQRTSGRILIALVAYFSFFNLQRLAESWFATGATPPWLGSLWYQLAVLAVVYLVMLPESFWVKRLRHRLSSERQAA